MIINQTDRYLDGYIQALHEIEVLLLQHKEIYTLREQIAGFKEGDLASIESSAAKLEEIERKISEKIKQIAAAAREIKALIEDLPEGKEKTVLTWHYINGLPPEAIADKMHYAKNYIYQLLIKGRRMIEKIQPRS